MKLKQHEFCHNCNEYVDFEFDDVTDKQVIHCPKCGHEHYRELDEGTIVNIRMENTYSNKFYVADLPSINDFNFADPSIIADTLIAVKTFTIRGQTADGRPIIEKTNEINHISTEDTKVVTNRRWGRDSRQ